MRIHYRFVHWKRIIAIVITAWVGTLHAAPKLTPELYDQWFRHYQNPATIFPESAKKEISDFQYVFIPGVLNEGRRFLYFRDTRNELAVLGVPKSQIHLVSGSSWRDIESNSEKVSAYLKDLVSKNPTKKLVIVGHSKGAAEGVAALLKEDTLSTNNLHYFLGIQSAAMGSQVTNYVLGKGEFAPLDSRMNRIARPGFYVISKVGRGVIWAIRGSEGANSLTTDYGKRYWPPLLEARKNRQGTGGNLLADQVYFLRSSKKPSSPFNPFGWSSHYLQTYYGANDWRLTLDSQSIPGLGTLIGDINAHHDEIAGLNPFASASVKANRRALARTLVTAAVYLKQGCDLTGLTGSVKD